jgi:hypothetical protein
MPYCKSFRSAKVDLNHGLCLWKVEVVVFD